MNCLEFRRIKLVSPRSLSPQALVHAKKCAHCSAFSQEIDDTEQKLECFAEHSVPSGIEDRIILSRNRQRFRQVRTFAVAASILLASGLGFFAWDQLAYKDHAQLAIKHVVSEPYALKNLRNDDTVFFEKVLSDFGGKLNAPLGKVRYMKLCSDSEGNGWHVVLETEQGLATLMLIPGSDKHVKSMASSQGWHAVAESAGHGYYVIVTQTPEQAAVLRKRIQQNVRWS